MPIPIFVENGSWKSLKSKKFSGEITYPRQTAVQSECHLAPLLRAAEGCRRARRVTSGFANDDCGTARRKSAGHDGLHEVEYADYCD